jgi:hypothetical protein
LNAGDSESGVCGEVESGWFVPGHDELGTERGDHRAVIGAEAERWDAQLDAGRFATLGGHLAKSAVGNYAASEK